MHVFTVYAICFTAPYAFMLGCRLWNVLCQRLQSTYVFVFLKQLCYPLIAKRLRGSSNVTILEAILITGYVTGNSVAMFLHVSDLPAMQARACMLCGVNMVPLFLGGRTSLLADRVFRLNKNHYDLMHRWIGRVCLVQAVLHGVIGQVTRTSSTALFQPITLVTICIMLGTTSILFVRRAFYEVFLKLHLLLALALIALLWFHVGLYAGALTKCVMLSSILWAVQTLAWLIILVYRNWGLRAGLRVVCYGGHSSVMATAVELTMRLKQSWALSPGQYVYLTVPRLARQSYGLPQAHPYLIMWYSEEDEEQMEIVVLIERRQGFSDKARLFDDRTSIIVDGPYGGYESFDRFDKIIFFASGIGIAAYLVQIRELLRAHDKQTARVRRLTFNWELESLDQERWLTQSILSALARHIDLNRPILNINIFLPPESTDANGTAIMADKFLPAGSMDAIGRAVEVRTVRIGHRWTNNPGPVFWLNKEWDLDAGNMAVSVCGNPLLEREVRRAVSASSYNISLIASTFQPDGPSDRAVAGTQYHVTDSAKASTSANMATAGRSAVAIVDSHDPVVQDGRPHHQHSMRVHRSGSSLAPVYREHEMYPMIPHHPKREGLTPPGFKAVHSTTVTKSTWRQGHSKQSGHEASPSHTSNTYAVLPNARVPEEAHHGHGWTRSISDYDSGPWV